MIRSCIIILAISISTQVAQAQNNGLFIKGGINLANVSRNGERNLTKTEAITSFQAGLMANYQLGSGVSIQPSLLFTGKGAQVKSSIYSASTYFEATARPYYIELPVNAVLNIPLKSRESHFFVGGGPYVALGIGGKNKAEGVISGGMPFSINKPIKYHNETGDEVQMNRWAGMGYLQRLDYGVNATAGIVLDRLMLSVNYGYGLTDINRTNFDYEDKYRHRVLSLTAGFRLK